LDNYDGVNKDFVCHYSHRVRVSESVYIAPAQCYIPGFRGPIDIAPNGGWQSIFVHTIFERAWYTHVTTQWRQPCINIISAKESSMQGLEPATATPPSTKYQRLTPLSQIAILKKEWLSGQWHSGMIPNSGELLYTQ
jgi:hypothetical protein